MNAPKDLRLSEAELTALRHAFGAHAGSEQRKQQRHPLPEGFALVVRTQPESGPGQTFSASARDMSASGMGFYHTTYVHPGTVCAVLMRTLKGDAVAIPATAARCQHVSGRVHEVGVVFANEIEVGQFVQGAAGPADSPGFDEDSHARVSRLVGDLKLMVDQRATRGTLLGKLGELSTMLAPQPEPASEPAKAETPPPISAAA